MEEAKESEQKIKIPKPRGPGIFDRLKNKISQFRRVLEVSQKPDREEFVSSAKITGVGIIFIGIIGFVIFLLYYLVVK